MVPGFSTDAGGNIINANGSTRPGGLFPNPDQFGPNGGILQSPPPGGFQWGDVGGGPPPAPPTAPRFNVDTDPGVLNALALEQQGLGSLDAMLKGARERAIISFGDPSLADQAGFGLDPQAGAFARQNYLSGNATSARMEKQHELQRQAIINKLAGHGLLFSGDTGYLQGQENQTYGNTVYDAKQQLLDYLANLFQSYNDRRTGLRSQTQSARLQAIQSYLSNPDAYAGLAG